MKYNGDSKKIKSVKVTKSAEPEKVDEFEELDFTPAPEDKMDYMTEEDEKKRKRNIAIGIVVGVLIAALLIGLLLHHQNAGKIPDAEVTTVPSTTLSTTTAPATTRTYDTRQLTVHRDQNGVWRSYAGLEPTVGYTGVVGNDTGWWYVENDVVNFKFNGIASNDYGQWLVENGKVNFDYTGEYVYNNLRYGIEKGKVVKTDRLTTTSATSTTTTATTTTTTTTTASTTTTDHEHDWVTVYDGDAIIQTGVKSRAACVCTECGLIFADAELLRSHAYAENHALKYDRDGALASQHILSKEEVGDKDVISGYTKEENMYWVCTVCGTETHDANDTDYYLR